MNWTRALIYLGAAMGLFVLLSGCAHPQPQPVSPLEQQVQNNTKSIEEILKWITAVQSAARKRAESKPNG